MDLLNLFQEDLTTDLTEQETTLLNECELVIERGVKAFKEVGQALLEIRESKLYRTTHKSFKSYCFEKWGISEAYATRNIKAFEINENIKDLPIGKGLLTESQLRPLTNLEPEIQRQVMKEAQEINPKAPTSLIEDVVSQYGGVNAVLKELKLNPDLVFNSEQELIDKAKSLVPTPAPVEIIKEVIKDESLLSEIKKNKDTINQLQSRIVEQSTNYSSIQNKLIKYENEIQQLTEKVKESQKLKDELSNYQDIKESLLTISELEKKKSDLFKYSQKVKDILEVLDSSRKFFNQNVLAIGAIQLDYDIKESLQSEIIELVNIVDSWKFAVSKNLLLDSNLIGV